VVTGAAGFAGRHLLRHLESSGAEPLPSEVRLPDRAAFARLLEEARPAAVVHLAAVSFLPAAERDPERAIAANVDGTRSILEALRQADPDGRVRLVFASSGQVYRAAEGALDEDAAVEPASVYGRTKLAAELFCRLWCEASRRRPLWVFRAFNHIGPGQRPEFAASSFARQVALMESGQAEPVLRTGDLAVRRDFTDVRDVVRAYGLAALGKFPPGTYNLASGRTVSLAELAGHYRARSRIAFEILGRPEAGREGEVREVRASAERLRAACGWTADITLERTLDDLLADWRSRVAQESGGGSARPMREAPVSDSQR